jgi:pyruvate kinase
MADVFDTHPGMPLPNPRPVPDGPQARRTKIVATIGPASRDPQTLRALIDAGIDVARLNFSHGTRKEHADNIGVIREAAEAAGREIGILGDLPGPKLRLDDLGRDVVVLHSGDHTTLTTIEGEGSRDRLPVAWDGLPGAVAPGDHIYLADGRVSLRAMEVTDHDVRCEVEAGGAVTSHQGINLPRAATALPAAGEDDLDWIDFAVEHEIDLLAVSFVRSAADLEPVAERLRKRSSDIPLIAKIEKPQAAENAEEIVEAAGSGIMVARGDLGIEVPIAQVPVLQKRLLKLAGQYSKPSVTATQMLASMTATPHPTRAEVTDVANAIYDGTDAVMLSEETAVGEHPIEAVRVMDQIARATEQDLPYGHWATERTDADRGEIADSVAQGAVYSTYRLGLAALVVPTRSGRTARLVSAFRPRVPVLALTPRLETVRRLNLLFGVQTVLSEDWESLRTLLDECAEAAREAGVAGSGDLIGITAGLPEQQLGTNLFEVHRVP